MFGFGSGKSGNLFQVAKGGTLSYYTLGASWPRRRLREAYPRYVRRFLPPFYGRPLGADSLRFYFTGAVSDGGSQSSQAASLGGYRSSTEAERVGLLLATPIRGLSVLFASRQNGTDGAVGSVITAADDEISYTAPGSATAGDEVALSIGGTATLTDGEDPSKWIRVARTDDFAGLARIEFDDQLNNVFGMSNAANAESTSGGSRYRAVMVKNESSDAATAIKFWLDPLGTQTTSSVGQLSGSGAGTITAATDGFCDWPYRGWARVEDSGGTLKEVVYYSSRTDTVLTVPSLGRGRLGTSATAGSATDVIYPIPGIRIAWEASSPTVGGSVQTIGSESTAPTGLSWSVVVTSGTALSVGALPAGQQGALWIHRELPAGVSASAKVKHRIKCSYSIGSESFSETLCGMYRIAVDARARYELYIGVGSAPDITGTPTETFTSLPHTTTATLGVSTTNYLVTLQRNKYDLRSESLSTTIIRVNGSGVEIDVPPTAPTTIQWTAGLAGVFNLAATYFSATDESPADTWLIYTTFNGVDPDPALDTPTEVDLFTDGGFAQLSWTSAAQIAGTTGKVLVRVRRSGTPNSDSTNVDVYTATATTTGPTTPSGRAHFRPVAEQT